MKIRKLDLHSLHNEEHYQFGTDVLALIKGATPAALGIETAAAALTAVHGSSGRAHP